MSKGNTIVKVDDRTTIACVKFKFPDLMSEEAEQKVVAAHKEFLDAQNALYDARNKVRECEAHFQKAKEKWMAIQQMADIEYVVTEREIASPKSNSMIFKGYGNSTLGYSNY